MKLKKLFWVNILFVILISCKSNNLIPGLNNAKELNIYSEYMSIADEYFSLKKFDKAQIYYTKCLDSKDFYWQAYYSLAKTYLNLAKYQEALDYTLVIYSRDKENQTIKETLAYLYAMLGEKEQSINLYNELILQNGQINSYYENLIIIYIKDKNIEKSQEVIALLKEKFPDNQNISKYQSEIDKLIEPKTE